MQSLKISQLVARFKAVPRKQLNFLTPIIKIQGLFSQQTQQPQSLNQNIYDPNDFYIEPRTKQQKKVSNNETKQKKILLIGKSSEDHDETHNDQKKKNYKAGPFAIFYEINEGKLNKDAQVWYYKDHKDIVGPVSSYNMDKMHYYKSITDETRIAFKSVQKFVKFSKIKKIVQEQKKQHVE